MSQGDNDMRGPWNQGEQWEYVTEREKQMAVDGGDGGASVNLTEQENQLLQKATSRTQSKPDTDPVTGADLGAGPGAGKTKASSR